MSRPSLPEVAATVARLVRLHREAMFAQRTRVAVSNRFAAFVRTRVLGVSTFDGKEALAKAARETARIRKALASGAPLGVEGLDPDTEAALRVLEAGVRAAAEPFERFEAGHRRQMGKAAATLPGAGFVLSTRGLGVAGFAMLVGEAGDLAGYPTHQHLWKRLGMAVIHGERQQRKTNPLLAEAHGYDPGRRAVAWVVVDSLLRGQSTDPPGPYRVAYDQAKAAYLARGWTKAHAHAAARRKAGKLAVKRLWQAWRRDVRALASAKEGSSA